MAPSPQRWDVGILNVIQIVNLKKATLFAVRRFSLRVIRDLVGPAESPGMSAVH
jgi:hypothetical protein